jgi:hypothetical protein
MNLNLPAALEAEIASIFHMLEEMWPQATTIRFADEGDGPQEDGHAARHLQAVRWMIDHGLMACEDMFIHAAGFHIREAVLTPKGRRYAYSRI